jgi:hypothetical protein
LNFSRTPLPVRLTGCWLAACAYLNLAGWVLSGLGALNATGYAVALLAGVAGAVIGCRPWTIATRMRLSRGRAALRRFRRALPILFLLYAVVAFVGGMLYAPNNYDGLTYRLPRLLHWLAAERWHWIATENARMNISAAGFEWLMAPWVALTGSDRALFLINTVSYLLMPGLVYATFIRLGIRKRVAWYWMWLLPVGYGFVLQAGGIGNDLISAIYFLAALGFLLRARDTCSLADLALGAVAAALLTGAKASNLPLLLPCALAAWPSLKLLRARPVAATALVLLTLSISFLPIAAANSRFTGDWTGDPTNKDRLKVLNPVYGVLGNSLQMAVGNLAPPVGPFARQLNEVLRQQTSSPWGQKLLGSFPRFNLSVNELAQEEAAGLGLGLVLLLGVSALFGARTFLAGGVKSSMKVDRNVRAPMGQERRGWGNLIRAPRRLGIFLCVSGWVALLVYMTKMGSEATARLLIPYYPLLVASMLLLPGAVLLVRRRWWRTLAVLTALSALPAVILSASRPLSPARSIVAKLQEANPNSGLLARAAVVYNVYAARADALAPLRKFIPDSVSVVGFAGTTDESETSLWRPFGSRRVLDFTSSNAQELLNGQAVVVVASERGVSEVYAMPLEEWLTKNRLRVIGSEMLLTKATEGPERWVVAVREDAGR